MEAPARAGDVRLAYGRGSPAVGPERDATVIGIYEELSSTLYILAVNAKSGCADGAGTNPKRAYVHRRLIEAAL